MKVVGALSVPPNLRGLWDWLHGLYPTGIPSGHYRYVLAVLASEMSDRNVSSLISAFTGRDYAFVYNDVIRVQAEPPIEPEAQSVRSFLESKGFMEFMDVEDSPSQQR